MLKKGKQKFSSIFSLIELPTTGTPKIVNVISARPTNLKMQIIIEVSVIEIIPLANE